MSFKKYAKLVLCCETLRCETIAVAICETATDVACENCYKGWKGSNCFKNSSTYNTLSLNKSNSGSVTLSFILSLKGEL